MNEWTSRHAQLNEAGNFLIEATETSTSFVLTEQLSKVNKSWAERMKKTVFVRTHAVNHIQQLILMFKNEIT